MVTPERAAVVLETSSPEIQGLLASGDLHAVAEASGANLICGNSLSATLPAPEATAAGLSETPVEAGE